jgi:hypothetical protein
MQDGNTPLHLAAKRDKWMEYDYRVRYKPRDEDRDEDEDEDPDEMAHLIENKVSSIFKDLAPWTHSHTQA